MKYIAYVRKSTEQAERQSLSIPAQKRKIQEIFPDLKIVKWIEESQSAFKVGREGYNTMLELLDDKKAEGIICWHPDRLSRNAMDAAQIVSRIGQGVIEDLKFGSYTFDNSPEGIMMLQMTMSQSQYFSAKLSKDVKRGNDEQRKRGWLTGRAMEGYINQRSRDGQSFGIIVEDPERFALRRQMWDLMLTGKYSIPQINKIATEQWGYRTRGDRRTPSGPMSRSSLYAMFTNPRYVGLIPVPGQSQIFEKAAYKPMVTAEEFDRVQEILGNRHSRLYTSKKDFPFRGIMFCGECGCKITAEDKTRNYKNGKSQKFIYYHCTHRRPCSQKKNTRQESLEEQFIELLGKYTILPQFKDWALETLDKQNELETSNINAIRSSQNKTIEKGHKQIKKLISMAARELISEDEFKTQKSEIQSELTKLEEETSDTSSRAKNWYDTFTRTFELAVHGKERFMNGDLETKKEILAAIGQNLILIDGTLKISTYPWLQVIENNYPKIEKEYKNVRTQPLQIQKASLEAVRSSWLSM